MATKHKPRPNSSLGASQISKGGGVPVKPSAQFARKKYRRSACVSVIYNKNEVEPRKNSSFGADPSNESTAAPIHGGGEEEEKKDSEQIQEKMEEKKEEEEEVDLSKMSQMRHRAVLEILTSEESYLTSLMLVRELYFRKLEERIGGKGELLTNGEIQQLLGNFPILISYSKALYNQLRASIQGDDSSGLSTVFTSFVAFLQIYKEYTKNYSISSQMLADLCKERNGLQQFLAEIQMTPQSKGLSFHDYLIMPVQRIPRYVMLLKEVCKYTPTSDPDFDSLTTAYAQVANLAKEINESKRRAERQDFIVNLQKKIGGGIWLLKPHRYFIDEGEMWDLDLLSQTCRSCFVLLFNDVLLVVRKLAVGDHGHHGKSLFFMRGYSLLWSQLLPLPWMKENILQKGRDTSGGGSSGSSGKPSFKKSLSVGGFGASGGFHRLMKNTSANTTRPFNQKNDVGFQVQMGCENPLYLIFNDAMAMSKWRSNFKESLQFCQEFRNPGLQQDPKYTIGLGGEETVDLAFRIQHPIHGVRLKSERKTKGSFSFNFFYGSDAVKWMEKSGLSSSAAAEKLEQFRINGLFVSASSNRERFRNKKYPYRFACSVIDRQKQLFQDVQKRASDGQTVVVFSLVAYSQSLAAVPGKRLLEEIQREFRKVFDENRLDVQIQILSDPDSYKHWLIQKRQYLSENNIGAFYHQSDHLFWATIDGTDIYLGTLMNTLAILYDSMFFSPFITSMIKNEISAQKTARKNPFSAQQQKSFPESTAATMKKTEEDCRLKKDLPNKRRSPASVKRSLDAAASPPVSSSSSLASSLTSLVSARRRGTAPPRPIASSSSSSSSSSSLSSSSSSSSSTSSSSSSSSSTSSSLVSSSLASSSPPKNKCDPSLPPRRRSLSPPLGSSPPKKTAFTFSPSGSPPPPSSPPPSFLPPSASSSLSTLPSASLSSSSSSVSSSSSSSVSSSSSSSSPLFCVQVLSYFKGEKEGDLEIKRGDIIKNVDSRGGATGWWKGECHGKIGYFPSNYVKKI